MTTERWRTAPRVLDRLAIRRLHRKLFLPVARSVSSFEEVGGATGESAWVDADPGEPALFERDPSRLDEDLAAIWRLRGRERLLPLARPLSKLASRARRRDLETDDEVSADVYAMQ